MESIKTAARRLVDASKALFRQPSKERHEAYLAARRELEQLLDQSDSSADAKSKRASASSNSV